MARDSRGSTSSNEWFEPISAVVDTVVSVGADCPGGVCPVPWATKKEPPVVQEDVVNHPAHYTETGGIECIEAIEAQLTTEEYLGYLRGNCVKYLWRWRNKGGLVDLNKASWYLQRLIETQDQKG
jgi:hypothetical protein